MTATPPAVTPDVRLTRSNDVLVQEIGGEAVLLDLASEQYFGLNAVGTRIWELLDGERPLADIHRLLCTEFDADATAIEVDLMTLAVALLDSGLVTRAGAP